MDISYAQQILDYWFTKDGTPDYDKWFLRSNKYDDEIKEKFGDLLKEAEKGKGYGWLISKDSFVAYIILMDQFSRHIYRGSCDAFKNDKGTMIFTELGFEIYKDDLIGYEFMFAFMPYMHTESLLYQEKGKEIFNNYYSVCEQKQKQKNMPTLKSELLLHYQQDLKMLKSMKNHMEGHFVVIEQFGRFPKRNEALGRISTQNEINYMNQPHVRERPY
jgi:uncharacterized protein (DUF924 family)